MSDNNALAIFGGSGGQLPAHIAAAQNELGSNVTSTVTVPSLSYEGKTWSISKDGDKHRLTRKNDDGDDEPISTMRVVVLDAAKRRGRAYYEGTYDPGKTSAPLCWSDDGVEPDASLPAPDAQVEPGSPKRQSLRCDTCPMAVKGSKVNDQGKATVACSSHRMLAVAPVTPAGKILADPLRLKIAITSDWDKNSPQQEQQNWRAWQQHQDFLKARGVTHTALLVTKMKFDPDTAYPKLFFQPDRWLEADELALITPLAKSEEVQSLLGGTYTPAGVDGVRKDAEPQTTTTQQTAEEPAAPPPPPPPPPPAAEVVPAETKAVPADVADLLSQWG